MTKRYLIGLLFACVLPIATYGSTEGTGSGGASADESVPSLQSVRPEFSANGVQVSIQTRGQVQYHDFALQNPNRIVLDFPGARSAMGNRAVPVTANQYVKLIRIGQPQPGVTRVVLDTSAQVSYRVTQDDSVVLVSLGSALESRPRTVSENVASNAPVQNDPDFQDKFGNVPKVEVFGGYTFARPEFMRLGRYNANGGDVSASVNFGRYLGITFDFSTFSGAASIDTLATNLNKSLGGSGDIFGLPGELDYRYYTLMAGPRLAVRSGRMTTYLHALVGAAHVDYGNFNQAQASFNPFLRSVGGQLSGRESTSIAAAFGGGFDVQLTPQLSLRVGQVEYLLTHFQNLAIPEGTASRSIQNNIRVSTGLVFRFGDATH